MFEVGFTEIILILGIALLVLGPEKLPKLANQVGRWAGRARAMARQLRQQLDEEVTVIGKDDFGPKARKPPGTPAVGTPPPQPEAPAPEAPATAEKPDTPSPPL
ncbi:MAG TPA: Sec-independent protein translocase protein TatB [Steroidobacteraceae bacterium]|nr:Sec-independent protein translocase protein TatB [Steroidobacteraceae bacterium]